MKKLYLIRGVSGSGKTTLAKELEYAYDLAGASCYTYAADDYFYDEEGNYNFDAAKLSVAHGWCKAEVSKRMSEGTSRVIVHNTFTSEKELRPYLALGEEFGYEVTVFVVENRHESLSVHDVPMATLVRQKRRLIESIQL